MQKDSTNGNGELEDSLVACQTAAGGELCGRLTRLSRFAIVFEVYSPDCVLQLSQVLKGFRILIHNRVIYSGDATVRNLINAGPVLFCEVTLCEGAWQDVQLDPAFTQNGALRDQFGEFLQEWQRVYRVLPEYKMIIADIQVFLTDLRLWLEQLELNFLALPSNGRARSERDLVDGLVQPISSSLDHLFQKFEATAHSVADDLKPIHSLYAKRQLHPLLLCSPFMHRIYQKPLGYAGDYEMVSMILRDPHEGTSAFSRVLNRWFLAQVPAEAHRNRIRFLTQRITEESLRCKAQAERLRVFNIGCGPAKEVADFVAERDFSDTVEFTLLDFNQETLKHAEMAIAEAKRNHNRITPVRLQKKSVANVLKSGSGREQYDLIYCAGLFDYLQDRVCKQLMNVLYDTLAPGGTLIVTNVDPGNPIRYIMDFIFEWHLIYRNGAQLSSLIPDAAPPDDCKVQSDPTGCNVYLEVKKNQVRQ